MMSLRYLMTSINRTLSLCIVNRKHSHFRRGEGRSGKPVSLLSRHSHPHHADFRSSVPVLPNKSPASEPPKDRMRLFFLTIIELIPFQCYQAWHGFFFQILVLYSTSSYTKYSFLRQVISSIGKQHDLSGSESECILFRTNGKQKLLMRRLFPHMPTCAAWKVS